MVAWNYIRSKWSKIIFRRHVNHIRLCHSSLTTAIKSTDPDDCTMQKICYTYVKPRMYNKVILVVYIPYVILMFTCGV